MYLGWFDDTNKKSVMSKIDEAVERFTYRFGVAPAVCLVSEAEVITHPVVEVRAARHVRPHHFFVGRDDLEAILQAEASGVRQSRPATTAVSISNKPATKRAKAATPTLAPELPAAVAAPVIVAVEEPKPARKSRRTPAISELTTIVAAPQYQAEPVLEIAVAPATEATTPTTAPVIAVADEPKPTRKSLRTNSAPEPAEMAALPELEVTSEPLVVATEEAKPARSSRRTAAAPKLVETVASASTVPELEVAPAPELLALESLVLETQEPKPARKSRRTATPKPIAAVAISAPEEPVIVVPEIAEPVAAEVRKATRRRKTDTIAPAELQLELVSPVEAAPIVEVEPEQPVTAAPAKATGNSRKRATAEVIAPEVPVIVAEAVVVPEVPAIVAEAEAAAPVEPTRRKKRAIEQVSSEPVAAALVAEPLPLPEPVEVEAVPTKPEPRRRPAKTPVIVEAQPVAPMITVEPEAAKRNPRKKAAAASAVPTPTMPATPARRGRKPAGSYVQAQMELPLAS